MEFSPLQHSSKNLVGSAALAEVCALRVFLFSLMFNSEMWKHACTDTCIRLVSDDGSK